METSITAEQILESNKLIAEFMEISTCSDIHHMDDKCYYFGVDGYLKAGEAKYNTSWDWLMPVVEKIKSLRHGWHQMTDIVLELQIGSTIDEVYQAVIEFIRAYKQSITTTPINLK